MGKKYFIHKGEKKDKAKTTRKAKVIKKANPPEFVVGVIVEAGGGCTLKSASRKDNASYTISKASDVRDYLGQLVKAKVKINLNKRRQNFDIIESLGDPEDHNNISSIAIAGYNIPHVFSDAALKEANAAKPVTLDGRTDLRDIPFVTIDGADARDFDDAVYAEKSGKGWKLSVAIADVAHYVRPGSALDKDAYKRGNSTYLPDRVVPMLPEALSNDLCSLRPAVDRACLAVHMWINSKGDLTKWQFERGVMRSCARLTYEQIQAAHDGKPDKTTKPLIQSVIVPLYGAYETMAMAREARGTLDISMIERKILLNKDGTVKDIVPQERLNSHRLIEEFMITANIATALQLGAKAGGKQGCMCIYRVHEKPMELKMAALRDYFSVMDITLPPDREMHPKVLSALLKKFEGSSDAEIINEVVLRAQSQAAYSPKNIGHFGLALPHYAHFTSPIRRYADLMVHRALIRTCTLGKDGLRDDDMARLEAISDHISQAERRSVMAERETFERYASAYMKDKVGQEFKGTISGVAPVGLFVRLKDNGAEGLLPASALPRDYYTFDKANHRLIGQRNKQSYSLTDTLTIRVEKVTPLTGGILFGLAEGESTKTTSTKPAKPHQDKKARKSMRGRNKRYGI